MTDASPCRVLHLMQCTYLGGTEQTLYALMRGLHGKGYEFEIHSLHPPGVGAELMERVGISTIGHTYRGKFGWRTHGELRRSIERRPCDLALVSGPTLTGALAIRAARAKSRVLTVHYHHGRSLSARLKWKTFYKTFGPDYQCITFLTDFIRREAEAVAPALAPRFRTVPAPVTIPSPISPQRRAQLRRHWNIPADVPVVGNAGQLIPRKRFDLFLDAAAEIARRHRDVHFLIAGDGPVRAGLEARSRSVGSLRNTTVGVAGDRVHFIGWQEDTASVFSVMDVLLFNSDADAFGRTPLEAMAVGVPVVASVLYGGTDELIEHQHNGVLLARHDTGALADAVCALLENERLATLYAERALRRVRERHSMDHFLATYRDIFERARASQSLRNEVGPSAPCVVASSCPT